LELQAYTAARTRTSTFQQEIPPLPGTRPSCPGDLMVDPR
jgi:hypothetical protein